MILKQEKIVEEICKTAPKIDVPFKGIAEKTPSRFYTRNSPISQVVAGYREGPRNPYVEELMKM